MKKLKIAEQLTIVLLASVFIPVIIATFIINNVNQHAVRKELEYSSSIITESIYQRLNTMIEAKEQELKRISVSLNYIGKSKRNSFLSELAQSSPEVHNFKILNAADLLEISINPDKNSIVYDPIGKNLIILQQLQNGSYLCEFVSSKSLQHEIFKITGKERRQIYILDSNKKEIISHNYNETEYNEIIEVMPNKTKFDEPIMFNKIKNQPKSMIKMKNPNWTIITSTPEFVTNYTIIKARYKIILALLVMSLTTLIVGATYTYSLYINIRQLFKGIMALANGNYRRKIRLLTNFFTPYETIFLANEFNKMAEKIDLSYKELQNKNKKLKQLDKYKSNLIDTVSHELRTPLTSIKGYTSRLLRNDINIDQETRIKSLKVIKRQSERLSRMVEDLLVIPDIESSLIRVMLEPVDLKETINSVIMSAKHKDDRIINFNSEDNIPNVIADKDRLEQVILNLLDNAIKYSDGTSQIDINVLIEGNNAVLTIKNMCEYISQEKLNSLFGKFTRLDAEMTRTTRGTGLGLYIVKGLVKAMKSDIHLAYNDGFEVSVKLPLAD